jgi:uncharacterized surface protein with fasciclin (FAS1) repeats/plastocyanin
MRIVAFIALLSVFVPVVGQCEADHTVVMADYYFAPASLTISPGESVAFINVQGNHNVNAVTNTLTGEPFGNPVEFFLDATEGTEEGTCMGVVVFDVPGVYQFDSSIGFQAQLGMTGTITVDAVTLADQIQSLQSNTTELTTANVWQSCWAMSTYFSSTWGGQANTGWLGDLDLDGNEPYTVFIPTDDAVDDLMDLINLSQFDMLAFYDMPAALQYHIVPGVYLAEDLQDGLSLATAEGQSLTVSLSDQGAMVDDAHIIDADIPAFNGVIHIIDKILAPAGYPGATVLDVVVQSEAHSLFEAAIFTESLDDDLRGQPILNDNEPAPGPFTVFAPTNAALLTFAEENGFANIGDLLTSQYMNDIVKMHIVEQEILAGEFANGQVLTTYGGAQVQVGVSGGLVAVEGSLVEQPNLLAYNGVVHSIDAVIPFDIPAPTGTCGTWTLEFFDTYDDDWDGSSINIVVDGEAIASQTLEGSTSDAYSFAVDQGSMVDIIYVPNGGGWGDGYELVDAEGTVVWASEVGGASGGPTSIYGLEPCSEEPSCGYVEVTLYDSYGDGWDYGSMTVFSGGEQILTFGGWGAGGEIGFEEATAIVAVENNEDLDFLYNASVFPEENGYTVVGPDGTLLVDQNVPGQAPESAFNVVVCEVISNVEGVERPGVQVYPNPSDGWVRINGLPTGETWIVSLTDATGRLVSTWAGAGNEALDLTSFQAGTYVISVSTAGVPQAPQQLVLR